jgi:hypothetical protein
MKFAGILSVCTTKPPLVVDKKSKNHTKTKLTSKTENLKTTN